MPFPQFAFIILALMGFLAAVRVVTARSPVHAALYLVLCFFCVGGVWLLLQAEFLALTLVLVYVGAVMVLFLFVVMMLDVNLERIRASIGRILSFGALFSVLVMAVVVAVMFTQPWPQSQPLARAASDDNTRSIGILLYSNYLLAFELAAVILLVAMLAAVALTLRVRTGVRRLDPAAQVKVTQRERLKVIAGDDPQWKEPA